MINLKKISIYGSALSMLAVTSCSDDVLEVKNTNQVNIDLFTNSVQLQQGALNGIYKPLQTTGAYSRWQYFLEDYTSDELIVNVAGQPDIQNIADYELTPESVSSSSYWDSNFAGFRRANAFLENIGELNDSNASFVAEARFLRAHYLFSLASRFGGVPLNLSTTPANLPRASYEDTFELIIDDLTFAAENLPAKGDQQKGRPTSGSAYAYLGKAHLFSIEPADFRQSPEVYDAAFDAFSAVSGYTLVSEYTDNFNQAGEYNDESLFEVDFTRQDQSATQVWAGAVPDGVTDITFRSMDYSSWGNSQPQPTLLAAYEEQSPGVVDPRQGDTFFFPGDVYGANSGNTAIWGQTPDPNDGSYTPASGTITSRKFSEYIDFDNSPQGSGVNFRIIRYADVLLMQAEAALFKSSPDMGLAIDLMNQVRARPSVNMPPYPTVDFPCSNIDETFEALVHERRIELALEGKRSADLARWNLDVAAYAGLKVNFNPNKRRFPIPSSETLNNPNFGAGNPQ